jgi:(R,R)-butanediol dehydrogenase / meso-butanediol dehydrogenase / diacetyl reductase
MSTDTMRAARFHGAGDIRIEDVPEPPAPGPGEVLLRVATAGICGSDAAEFRAGPVLVRPLDVPHPVTGHLGPLTLGHEFAGEVVAVGEGVENLREGMLVACGAGMSCGECPRCLEGRTNLCFTYATIGFHRDGALAEHVLAPADICFDAGAHGLTADTAAMAQPMAIAVHAARRGRVAEGELAVVIGVGGVGSFLAFAAAKMGAEVIVADLDPARLKVAADLGASRVVALADGETLEDAIAEAGRAPDVIFEVSGTGAGIEQAVRLAPRGGRVCVVGVQKTPPAVDLARVTLDELELIGTVAHVARDDFPEALRLMALRPQGWADVAPEVLPLDRLVDDGIKPMVEGASARIKTLIDPSAGAVRGSETASATAAG